MRSLQPVFPLLHAKEERRPAQRQEKDMRRGEVRARVSSLLLTCILDWEQTMFATRDTADASDSVQLVPNAMTGTCNALPA